LAVSFEGILSAFASYWARPEGAESPGDHVKQVTETFLRMVAGAAVGLAGREPAAGDRACERELYMSALDTNRLKELIAVVRGFGDDQRAVHLNALEQELARARVFDFQSVPYDVVTMNTRLRIRDLATGKTETHRIVYPVDLEKAPENTSVLAPLGTALLGYRVGSVVEAECDGVPRRYEVAEILYQPEAAGDYHL
jgi:regulator of nucleoside diphosphate kinase